MTSPKSRITRAFEWLVVAERDTASISDVARKLGIDWRTVKDAEKRVLEAEYRTVDLKGVARIGIDELHVFGNERKGRRFITVVRDLDTGRVLNVSRGKGESALKEFAYRLRRQKAIKGIRCVCMDMSNAYFAWVARNLGDDTLIVFDHFHVVMKMNEHINNIRRLAMAQVNSDTRRRLADLAESDEDKETVRRLMLNAKKLQDKAKEYLKGNKRLLLMNAEDVAEHPKAKARLDRMLAKYENLNAAYVLKEKLRSIYANAKTKLEAAGLFKDWVGEARATNVDDLVAMASTIEGHLDRGPPRGHTRLLGVPWLVERIRRGLQQQDTLADQAGVRLPRLQVLPAEGVRPAEPEVARLRLLTSASLRGKCRQV